jgi:DNA polymerase elongation subunit (family B)
MVVPLDFCSLYPSIIIGYNIDYSTWVTDDSIPNRKCNVMEWEDHIGCEHDEKVIRVNTLNNYIKKKEDDIKSLRTMRDSRIDKLRRQEIADEIKLKMEELKPYKKERSDIKKTISKHPMCEKRKYRFLKEPKGVLPTIIQNLLDARKNTRKEINKYNDKIKAIKDGEMKEDNEFGSIQVLTSLCNVLDKRQLALKVSANSMYGALGVKRGYLPLMPGAMCITYMGRTNIQKVSKDIQEIHGGKLVYGDTDSNYVCFPHLTTAQETWAYALKVADEISMQFPPPVRIDFEEAIYSFFFILTKKRYMYRACDALGNINNKIGKKGVLLARRDNSKFVRDVYETVISKIADGINCNDILYYIIQEINGLLSHSKPIEDFIVTKSVGNSGNVTEIAEDPESFMVETKNEKTGKKSLKIQVGDYKVTPLSKKPKEKEEQLRKKNVDNDEDYYIASLPAQVQLALRMKNRGMIVQAGTRLEYVVAYPNNQKGKLYDKLEDVEYIKKHGDIIKLDYMYYLKNLVIPLDQMCNVSFKNIVGFKADFV